MANFEVPIILAEVSFSGLQNIIQQNVQNPTKSYIFTLVFRQKIFWILEMYLQNNDKGNDPIYPQVSCYIIEAKVVSWCQCYIIFLSHTNVREIVRHFHIGSGGLKGYTPSIRQKNGEPKI